MLLQYATFQISLIFLFRSVIQAIYYSFHYQTKSKDVNIIGNKRSPYARLWHTAYSAFHYGHFGSQMQQILFSQRLSEIF